MAASWHQPASLKLCVSWLNVTAAGNRLKKAGQRKPQIKARQRKAAAKAGVPSIANGSAMAESNEEAKINRSGENRRAKRMAEANNPVAENVES